MSDPTDILAAAAGTGIGALLLREMAQWFLRRGQEAQKQLEEGAASKLDQVLTDVGTLKSDVRVLVNDLGSHAATVREVKDRIDGISANHGARISRLEETVTRLDERAKPKRRT